MDSLKEIVIILKRNQKLINLDYTIKLFVLVKQLEHINKEDFLNKMNILNKSYPNTYKNLCKNFKSPQEKANDEIDDFLKNVIYKE